MLKRILAAVALLLTTEAIAFEGSYSAPVPDELKPHATTPVSDIRWATGDNNRMILSFTVPSDLTGSEVMSLEFREVGRPAAGFIDLSGPQGRATCISSQAQVICVLKYSRVNPNLQDVEAHLTAKYSDLSIRESKIRVAHRFAIEPAGLLEFGISQ